MIKVVSIYLENGREELRLDDASETEVIDELQAHIEDEFREMRDAGLSEEEAAKTCIKLLGSARLVARQIYEAHSQGSWQQAVLASLPHMFFAALFTLNWWHRMSWMMIVIGIIFLIIVYGWLRGRPVWIFSSLGYYVLPVAVAGLLMLYLPRGWSWVAIIIYLPPVLWLVRTLTIRSIRRDWLYGALMMLPVPIIVGWFLAVGKEGEFLHVSIEHIEYFAHGIGITFLVLAVTVAIFVRLRQRWLRVLLLPLSGILTLGMVAVYSEGRLSFASFVILILLMTGILLSPPIIEKRIRYGKSSRPAGADSGLLKSPLHRN